MKRKTKTILQIILIAVAYGVFCLLLGLFMYDQFNTYLGKRLFFQQYYEQHKAD